MIMLSRVFVKVFLFKFTSIFINKLIKEYKLIIYAEFIRDSFDRLKALALRKKKKSIEVIRSKFIVVGVKIK